MLRNVVGETTWMDSPITAEIVFQWLRERAVETTLQKRLGTVNSDERFQKALHEIKDVLERAQIGVVTNQPVGRNPDQLFELKHNPCGKA